jgi:hypothetical protein
VHPAIPAETIRKTVMTVIIRKVDTFVMSYAYPFGLMKVCSGIVREGNPLIVGESPVPGGVGP